MKSGQENEAARVAADFLWLVFGFTYRTVIIVACAGWEAWETWVWFSTLSITPSFPRPPALAIGTTAVAETALCSAAAAATWRRPSCAHTRCRSGPLPLAPTPPNSRPA